jgi:TonB family protein
VIAWMLYALVVGGACWAAAEFLARWARDRGRPERWIWVGALTATAGLPLLLPLLPRMSRAAVGTFSLPELTVGSGAGPAAAPVGAVLPDVLPTMVWVAMSLFLGVRLLRAAGAVADIVRRSPVVRRAPVTIRRTRDAGPAVAGLLRPVVLLPDRLSSLPRRERRWVLRHELEHVRAGDPALIWLARLVQVALPWNPAVWILGRRLHEGVEFDCDRRVLARRPDPRSYAETLLTLVAPPSTSPLPMAAFREPFLSLQRRFLAMTTPARSVSVRTLAALTVVAAVILVGACEFSPTLIVDREPKAEGATEFTAQEIPSPTDGPVFTPFTVGPEVSNREAVVEAFQAEYPPVLREAGIGGTARVWLLIDETGTVTDTRMDRSSGHAALDEAALRVAATMEFSPALNRDEPVSVWVAFPITFQVR